MGILMETGALSGIVQVAPQISKNIFSISARVTGCRTMSNLIPPTCRVPSFVGNKQIKFIEREVPKPSQGQLLLRVGANALCGSERPQFFDGSAVTPGHEAAG